MLSLIEQHYAKHKEDLRLQRRHGIVEYTVTMAMLHRCIEELEIRDKGLVVKDKCLSILDVGCGTGGYAIPLRKEGFDVECVELVQHNIDVLLAKDSAMTIRKGDARSMPWIPDGSKDVVLLLGPLYHLVGDEDKVQALREARRVLRPGGIMLVGYLMNEYSILQYCFDQERIGTLVDNGFVDDEFHVRTPKGELYDYVRLDDINRLNDLVNRDASDAPLRRLTIFSPEGPADYMRTRLNYMSKRSFDCFVQYQLRNCERPELLGAGSHLVDVLCKM